MGKANLPIIFGWMLSVVVATILLWYAFDLQLIKTFCAIMGIRIAVHAIAFGFTSTMNAGYRDER